MFVTLKHLYEVKLFTKEKLAQSTKYKWITPEQYKEITGDDYEPQA